MNKNLKKELIYIIGFFAFIAFVGFDIQRGHDIPIANAQENLSPSITQSDTHIRVGEVESVEKNDNPTFEELIKREFGNEGELAYAVALAEHRGTINPEAVNSTEVEFSVGVFQINIARNFGNGSKVHWDKIPGKTLEEKSDWLKIPENNIKKAKEIRGKWGWYPWSGYTSGLYTNYLNK